MPDHSSDSFFSEDGDELTFAPEDTDDGIFTEDAVVVQPQPQSWKVLVVDDEEEVHNVTQLALLDFSFEDKNLTLLNAYSGQEARQLLENHPDISLIFLDVVMETEDAGLRLVEYIRNQLENHQIRIILYTGLPDQALEHDIIVDYDINDYKVKSQITPSRLFTTVISALRSYRDILAVEE